MSNAVAGAPGRPTAGVLTATPPVAVTAEEFRSLLDFFYRKTGIVFGDGKRYFVDRRLLERMSAVGATSVRSYLKNLKYQDPSGVELQHLINAMTVNETYFYREEYQFRCLIFSILPEILVGRRNGGEHPIRLWSLPCSTGEEAYSLAIQLLENWTEVDRYDVKICASDIDTGVLKRAAAAIYDDRAMQHLSAALKARYFLHVDGKWQVIPDLRESIDFSTINLSDRRDMSRHAGLFDVIFCRNLLIYFDDISRRQAADSLFDALRPGGFLCLGHSESMSRISSLFTVRKFSDAIVYQKPK